MTYFLQIYTNIIKIVWKALGLFFNVARLFIYNICKKRLGGSNISFKMGLNSLSNQTTTHIIYIYNITKTHKIFYPLNLAIKPLSKLL